MTIGERIKYVRKELNLNQTEFGEKINLKQTTVAQLEKGVRNTTERNISSICEKFNVRNEWLRTGEGEIFQLEDSGLLSALSKKYHLDSLQRKIIECYLSLDNNQREAVTQFLVTLSGAVTAPLQADVVPFAAYGGGVKYISKEQMERDFGAIKPVETEEEEELRIIREYHEKNKGLKGD